MYLSLNLLKDFFPDIKQISLEKFESILNSVGIEVENIIKFPMIENLIVGEIQHISKPSENAKVNLCEVYFNNKIHKIICGGNNVEVNKKVIVAQIGTIMPDGRKIEPREIMGIKSEGMLCGYDELNQIFCNYKSDGGIVLLDKNVKINNQDVLKHIGLDDTIFDLSIPSNRNDLNGLFWIIKEISPFFSSKFEMNLLNTKKTCQNDKLKYQVNGSNLLKNIFLVNFDINDFELSWKSRYILLNSGITPTNTILDIAKIVQILTSIPILGFDSSKIKKTKFAKLDKSKTIKIDENDFNIPKGEIVLLNDNDDVILVPGIGVNDEYKITSSSINISFFASSVNHNEVFNLINENKFINNDVKISSKDLNYQYLLPIAFEVLINDLKVKFKDIKSIIKVEDKKPNEIEFDFKKVNSLLNTNLKESDINQVLLNMGYKKTGKKYTPPFNRTDVENDVDIIEDVLKVYGVSNIHPAPIDSSCLTFKNEFDIKKIEDVKKYLLSNGFYQIKTYNLCSKDELKYNYFNYENPIAISNPLSNDREFMRLSLLNGVLDTYSYNSRMNNNLESIFEFQNIYYDGLNKRHLILSVPNNIYENKLNNSYIKNDIFYIKNILLNIVSILNKYINFDIGFNQDYGCKNDSLIIKSRNKIVGYITRLNPELLKQYKINNNSIYVAEICIDDLYDDINKYKLVNMPSNNQKITKEITFDVSVNTNLNDIYDILNSQNYFVNYEIISEYQKDEQISYTLSFELNSINNESAFDDILDFFAKNSLKVRDK